MLTLITFKPTFGTLSPSPFALKADALLAMSGLPYKREFGDLRKAPMKKLPVLRDGDRLIPDSGLIQRYLEQEKGIDFDGSLSTGQKAVATAFRRLIEHHFYFINGHFRWTDHPDAVRDNFFAEVPALIRSFVFRMVDKSRAKATLGQGLGRHSRDNLIAFGREDIDAIAAQLGDKAFFFGDQPTSIDASLYGALENLITCELKVDLGEIAKTHGNLVAYCDRFREKFYNGKE